MLCLQRGEGGPARRSQGGCPLSGRPAAPQGLQEGTDLDPERRRWTRTPSPKSGRSPEGCCLGGGPALRGPPRRRPRRTAGARLRGQEGLRPGSGIRGGRTSGGWLATPSPGDSDRPAPLCWWRGASGRPDWVPPVHSLALRARAGTQRSWETRASYPPRGAAPVSKAGSASSPSRLSAHEPRVPGAPGAGGWTPRPSPLREVGASSTNTVELSGSLSPPAGQTTDLRTGSKDHEDIPGVFGKEPPLPKLWSGSARGVGDAQGTWLESHKGREGVCFAAGITRPGPAHA